MKRVLAFILLAALIAVPVAAKVIGTTNATLNDANGIPITTSFNGVEGDSLWLRVNDDSLPGWTAFDPTNTPMWLNWQFAEETTAKTAWFRFYELPSGLSPTIAVGDEFCVILDGEAKSGSFQVAMWDSVEIRVTGSGDAGVEAAVWCEVIK